MPQQQQSAADLTGPWCSKCGHPGTVTASSLDFRRPFGLCPPRNQSIKGCGHVLLTYVRAEAEAVQLKRRAVIITAHHEYHRPGVYREPLCRVCMTLPPGEVERNPGNLAGTTSAPAVATEGGQ